MKMYNQAQRIKQWGNQMDPEVTAEMDLESEDAAAADWARENEQELQQLDKDTINLYRRHRENADFRSLDALMTKRKPAESGQDPAKRRGNLPTQPYEVWIDRMLSQKPVDFEKVVENPQLAKALECLTPRQKEVVFQTYMKQRTPQQIAERLKTSDRNVRDVLTRAIANIKKILKQQRRELYGHSDIHTAVDDSSYLRHWLAHQQLALSEAEKGGSRQGGIEKIRQAGRLPACRKYDKLITAEGLLHGY